MLVAEQARGPILTREGKTTSNVFALEDSFGEIGRASCRERVCLDV